MKQSAAKKSNSCAFVSVASAQISAQFHKASAPQVSTMQSKIAITFFIILLIKNRQDFAAVAGSMKVCVH